MFFTLSRLLLPTLMLLLCSACATLDTTENWPTDIPDRQLFVDGFLAKRQLESADPDLIESHLVWIKRFYHGTVIYPDGWNRISNRFLATINDQRKKHVMQQRLQRLGIAIANEWAQDNAIRNIDNANIATWGSALRQAADLDDHEAYISKVEQDVNKLIAGQIRPREIDYERYYPEEDYDNF